MAPFAILLVVFLVSVYVMAGRGFVRSMVDLPPNIPRLWLFIIGAGWLVLTILYLIKQCFSTSGKESGRDV